MNERKTPDRRLELLAPAGGLDALRAAVRNGADAVYLGTTELNARRSAENFRLDALPEACDYAHLRGAKVYLTANVVVLQDEMRSALGMVARAWEAGVDAVIVQDLGLMACLRRSLPEVRIHASTQIDAHNAATIGVLERLGVSRVTLARELSVAEIAGLAAASGVQLESFVHGSLCFSHSGQCLMSSLIGGRSANRGQCAQPCRLPYDLVGPGGDVAEVPGRYLLSPKDLCGIDLLPQLAASGVAALKIEGRMKSPEYVATVVSVYRAAIDRVLADPEDFAVRGAESDMLEEAFNRGFTPGYLADVRDDSMMSYTRPNNRGVPLGRVAETRPGRTVVALERAVESGDTIEFWTAAGRFAQPAGALGLPDGTAGAAPAGTKVSIAIEKPVRTGDRVFRVANAALIEAARRSWQSPEERRALPLEVRVRMRIGEPLTLGVTTDGFSATATGPVVESARTRPVTAEDVAEHVGRLGGTPYRIGDVSVRIDAAAGVSFSELHRLRREAVAALDEARLRKWSERAVVEHPILPAVADLAPDTAARSARVAVRAQGGPRRAPALIVAVRDDTAARACLAAGADGVLLADLQAQCADPRTGRLLPRVVHQSEFEAVVSTATCGESASAAGNLGVVAALAKTEGIVESDWGLNVVNPWTAVVLADLGARLVWASPELESRQLADLVAVSPVPVGAIVGGRTELMIAEHCVLQAAGACAHVCATCARRRGDWVLVDRKGYRMPVTTDAAGRAHIYNAVPLDLSRSIAELLDAGLDAVRLEMQSATPDEAAGITREWRTRLDKALTGGQLPFTPIVEPSTTGHFYRGVR
jgi:putative protease